MIPRSGEIPPNGGIKGRVHELKTWPEPYTAILEGRKTFEIRSDDRGFAVGDILFLREYVPLEEGFTGRSLRVRVTYMVPAGAWGLPRNLCVMSIGNPSLIYDANDEVSDPACDEGDLDAERMVLEFLTMAVTDSEPIIANIYRLCFDSGFRQNEPSSLHEFGSAHDLEQVAHSLVKTCREDINFPPPVGQAPGDDAESRLYAIRLHGHSGRVQFHLYRSQETETDRVKSRRTAG